MKYAAFCLAALIAGMTSVSACDGKEKSDGHGKAKQHQHAKGGKGGRCGCHRQARPGTQGQDGDETDQPGGKPAGRRNNRKGNNGVGNGEDPQPPGKAPVNDGGGAGKGHPGAKGGVGKRK